MIYRIKLTIGYRDVYVDFSDLKDAVTFATTLLEHYKKPEDEQKYIMKVTIEVLSSKYNEMEND